MYSKYLSFLRKAYIRSSEAMPKSKKSQKVWLGFKIQVEPGPIPRPLKLEFWKPQDYKKAHPEAPFHYNADALAALSLQLLHKSWNPSEPVDNEFVEQAWASMEPMFEINRKAQPRVRSLRGQLPNARFDIGDFEQIFSDTLNAATAPWGFDFTELHSLVDLIEDLENKTGRPLLYNFQLQLSPQFKTRIHHLQSFLFHIRNLVAMDYNAYIQDPSHEALKVDSISDYIPRADYIANDAILYYHYRKVKKSLPSEATKTLDQAFMNYSHNGAFLIENLPSTFLGKLSNEELIESLYLIQMDWLMGTEAGLLYQIREEIFGLAEGYQKIFFNDYLVQKRTGADPYLIIQCQINEESLRQTSTAA